MNSATTPILVALVLQLALGLVVFQSNPRRKSNQSFLLLSCATVGWLSSLFFAFTALSSATAAFWIREASAFGVLNLASLNLLRLSICETERSWGEILRRSRLWLLAAGAVVFLCQTKWVLQEAHLSQTVGVA